MSRATGLDRVTATMIPPGATVKAVTWRLAHHYGPSVEAYATERDALAALIENAERRARDERDAEGLLPQGSMTIDLRWEMTWPLLSRDANGRSVATVGSEFTVSRVSYDSLDEAREHLARIDKYAPALARLENGDSLTVTSTVTLGENT